MSWWEKTKAWCLSHWRWLVFSLASLFAFLIGYSKAKDWEIKATDAKKNFDKEKEIIENSTKEQLEENLEHVKARDGAFGKNVLSFEKKMKHLKKVRAKRLREEIESNPNSIDEFLKDKGIDKE